MSLSSTPQFKPRLNFILLRQNCDPGLSQPLNLVPRQQPISFPRQPTTTQTHMQPITRAHISLR